MAVWPEETRGCISSEGYRFLNPSSASTGITLQKTLKLSANDDVLYFISRSPASGTITIDVNEGYHGNAVIVDAVGHYKMTPSSLSICEFKHGSKHGFGIFVSSVPLSSRSSLNLYSLLIPDPD